MAPCYRIGVSIEGILAGSFDNEIARAIIPFQKRMEEGSVAMMDIGIKMEPVGKPVVFEPLATCILTGESTAFKAFLEREYRGIEIQEGFVGEEGKEVLLLFVKGGILGKMKVSELKKLVVEFNSLVK